MFRHSKNPILTRSDIPDISPYLVDATSVFNPGAIKVNGVYYLMLRVQARSRETFLIIAESTNGVDFTVRNEIVNFRGIEKITEKIYHIYDARLTFLHGACYVMFAMDMDGGCQLGIGKTDDFKQFYFLGISSSDAIPRKSNCLKSSVFPIPN